MVLAGGLEEPSGELGGGVVQRKQKVPREAKGVKNGAVCGKPPSLVWMEHEVWQGAKGCGLGL